MLELKVAGVGVAAFKVMSASRLVAIDFHRIIEFVALTPKMARDHAKLYRTGVKRVFGELPYNLHGLSLLIAVDQHDGLVRISFTLPVGILVANPEVFLALADEMERVAEEIEPTKSVGAA